MKISASIYSSRDKQLEELARELDAYRIDLFHVDCNDDLGVFDDIRRLRAVSKTPIDLHVISSDPEKFLAPIDELAIEYVTFQVESLTIPFILPISNKTHFGISLVTETPVEAFKAFEDRASFVLFMATTPGVSGQAFNKQNFKKIRQFRSLYPDKKIHVDGGINAELSFIMRNMGVYSAVVGSYLLRQEFIGSALMQLHSDDIRSRFQVGDFMLTVDEIPVMRAAEFDFIKSLQIIEDYRMGFTNVVDENNMLIGIISNADVRKGLLKTKAQIDHLQLRDVMNPNPAIVKVTDTISDLLDHIKSLSFPVLFMPVVDDNHHLRGTIKFNNLIKGEL